MKKMLMLLLVLLSAVYVIADNISGIPTGWHDVYNSKGVQKEQNEKYILVNFSSIFKIPLTQSLSVQTKSDVYDYNKNRDKDEEKLERVRGYVIDCKNGTYYIDYNYILDKKTNENAYNIQYKNDKNELVKEYSVTTSDRNRTFDKLEIMANEMIMQTRKDVAFTDYEKYLYAKDFLLKTHGIEENSGEDLIARAVCTPKYKIKKSTLQDYQCYKGAISKTKKEIVWCGNDTPENLKIQAEDYYNNLK